MRLTYLFINRSVTTALQPASVLYTSSLRTKCQQRSRRVFECWHKSACAVCKASGCYKEKRCIQVSPGKYNQVIKFRTSLGQNQWITHSALVVSGNVQHIMQQVRRSPNLIFIFYMFLYFKTQYHLNLKRKSLIISISNCRW